MQQGYNISVIMPPNYAHSLAFWELAEGIMYALQELGQHAELHVNRFRDDWINIVLGKVSKTHRASAFDTPNVN